MLTYNPITITRPLHGFKCCEVLKFFPDNKSIFISNRPNTPAQIFNIQKQKVILDIPQQCTHAISISNFGNNILMGGCGGDLQLWDNIAMRFKFKDKQYMSVMVTGVTYIQRMDDVAVISGLAGEIKIRDFRQHKEAYLLDEENTRIQTLAYSQQQQLLAVAQENIIKIWDFRKMDDTLMELNGHSGDIWGCSFHPIFPDILVTVDSDLDAQLIKWNLKNGNMTSSKGNDVRCVTSLQFFKDSNQIVYSNYRYINILNEGQKLKMHGYISCMDLAFSGQLAVGCVGGVVNIFNINKWNKKQKE